MIRTHCSRVISSPFIRAGGWQGTFVIYTTEVLLTVHPYARLRMFASDDKSEDRADLTHVLSRASGGHKLTLGNVIYALGGGDIYRWRKFHQYWYSKARRPGVTIYFPFIPDTLVAYGV